LLYFHNDFYLNLPYNVRMNKLKFFCEILEIDNIEEISEQTELEEIDEWDSIGLLSIISGADDEFGVTLSPSELEEAKTVSDIIKLLP